VAKKVENLNLYSVRVREYASASQIEAASDDEAVRLAVKDVGEPDDRCEIVSREPIYEETVGIECSEDSSESAVFEIRVKGVDRARVERLAEAICGFIGGPGCPETGHSPEGLRKAVSGMMAFV